MGGLRMMYSSNAFWAASGYGVQGRSLLPRLAALPELGGKQNIAMFAWYGLQGGMHNVEGFAIYPGVGDPYGNDVIGAHMRDFGANWLVSLIDVWVMHQTAEKTAPAIWTPWLPIDHDPVPRRVLDSLNGAYLPLTYAKWGHELLTKAGVENHYIPHGIETDTFKVLTDRAKVAEFKRVITGIDGAHLSVMVAANKGFPDRKWFQGQIPAWAKFAADKPHARLYIHTEPTPMYGGLDLRVLADELGVGWRDLAGNGNPNGKIIFCDRYRNAMGHPPEWLTMIYNAADVHLQVSRSEGFGIPLIEAQACGCPVITTDFSAMPELVRWGYLVAVLDMERTPMESYQAIPDGRHMRAQMQRLYEQWEMCGGDWPLGKRLAVQDAIHAEFSWDAIVRDQWAPLVARIAAAAPPLDGRFVVGGVDMPTPAQDDVAAFVDAVNDGIAKSKDKPKRRVAPLTQPEAVAA